MVNGKLQTALIFIMMIGYFLLHTQYTDADLFDEENISSNKLVATTLAFSQRHTANNSSLSSLFHTTGLISDGFDVEALRIKKEGKMNFNYRMSVEKKQDTGLCDTLVLQAMYKGSFVYEGKLLDFIKDDAMSTNHHDWIYFLHTKSDQHIKGKMCEFTLIIRTWRNSPQEKEGFFDEHRLTNMVTSRH